MVGLSEEGTLAPVIDYYIRPMKCVVFDFLQTMFDLSSYSKKYINSKINIL
jgi:hypothetical protein